MIYLLLVIFCLLVCGYLDDQFTEDQLVYWLTDDWLVELQIIGRVKLSPLARGLTSLLLNI